MKARKMFGSRPTFGELLLQHVIVFLICVVFPGAVTWNLPATWLNFTRSDEKVSCRASTCVFYVLPYRVERIDPVTKIDFREIASKTDTQREFGKSTNHTVVVEGKGYLKIHGIDEDMIEVQVSPANLKKVVQESNDFLNSPSAMSKTLFVIANWKFGGLMGGVLTMFTVLYVVGYSITVITSIFKFAKRTWLPNSARRD